MNYAVIETGGKQYKVQKGETLEVENLKKNQNEIVEFEKVLLVVSDGKVEIGSPYVKNIVVLAKIVENLKGEKIHVMKFKSKVRHRRRTGYRHLISKIQIEDIKEKKSKQSAKSVKN